MGLFLSIYVCCANFHARAQQSGEQRPAIGMSPSVDQQTRHASIARAALREGADGTEDEAGSEHESDEREEDSSDDEARQEGSECVIA